jgi:hypothetical protein
MLHGGWSLVLRSGRTEDKQVVRTGHHAVPWRTEGRQYNLYSESLFRKPKYCTQLPVNGCQLDAARAWGRGFMHWSSCEHRHGGICFVASTDSERHRGLENQILARRIEPYERAREKCLERWSGKTYNWELIGVGCWFRIGSRRWRT